MGVTLPLTLMEDSFAVEKTGPKSVYISLPHIVTARTAGIDSNDEITSL